MKRPSSREIRKARKAAQKRRMAYTMPIRVFCDPKMPPDWQEVPNERTPAH